MATVELETEEVRTEKVYIIDCPDCGRKARATHVTVGNCGYNPECIHCSIQCDECGYYEWYIAEDDF